MTKLQPKFANIDIITGKLEPWEKVIDSACEKWQLTTLTPTDAVIAHCHCYNLGWWWSCTVIDREKCAGRLMEFEFMFTRLGQGAKFSPCGAVFRHRVNTSIECVEMYQRRVPQTDRDIQCAALCRDHIKTFGVLAEIATSVENATRLNCKSFAKAK